MKLIKFALLCLSVTMVYSVSAESFWRSLFKNRGLSIYALVRFFAPKTLKDSRYYAENRQISRCLSLIKKTR